MTCLIRALGPPHPPPTHHPPPPPPAPVVVFVIKKSQDDQFLYEASVQEQNEAVIAGLVEVWNMRLRLAQLVGGLRDLAKYGPMKPTEDQGIDEVKPPPCAVHPPLPSLGGDDGNPGQQRPHPRTR